MNTNKLLMPLVILTVLFLGVAGFAGWAYMGRQEYKNDSDQKAAAAAETARQQTQAEEAAKYAEEAKNPLQTFTGPSAFGSVVVQYPKTWSAYVVEAARGNKPLDAYFQPGVVTDVGNATTAYALRIEIVNTAYDRVLNEFQSATQSGQVQISPYQLPSLTTVTGSRIDGQIVRDKRGSMVVFPLRNVTLKVWAESEQALADFNNIILPHLTFAP